ncbi:MAG: TM0996/MTH895 family glutaredoxin-like protein [Candidatus Heimdallarchaeota archaeon]|nr:MAG: TM0996/MTH895 family glutaredoxin-like protein [Candidatus Heimdallarchaeota archaeon]
MSKIIVEVFGPGCAKCKALKHNAEEALEKLGWNDAELRYITNVEEYIERGIASTPALAVNGKVILSGKYLPTDNLVELLQKY